MRERQLAASRPSSQVPIYSYLPPRLFRHLARSTSSLAPCLRGPERCARTHVYTRTMSQRLPGPSNFPPLALDLGHRYLFAPPHVSRRNRPASQFPPHIRIAPDPSTQFPSQPNSSQHIPYSHTPFHASPDPYFPACVPPGSPCFFFLCIYRPFLPFLSDRVRRDAAKRI
ncbi:hypothetical protein C8Q70DRAFT_194981 [Cubamyces menziesii]|nr:hypothetical protein C8Q70DRAFT_194981 [Cubamyces menziesii]